MIPMPVAQLAYLRRVEESTMVRLVSIVHKTRVSDNAGGSTYTETTQANVPCRRTPNLAGNVETQFGGQLFSGLQWLFTFPHDTIVSNDDDIVDGTERFSVLGVLGPKTFNTGLRVMAVEK